MVASPVPWLMPKYLIDAIGPIAGLTMTASNRARQGGVGNGDGSEHMDGPIVPGQVVQYAAIGILKRDIADVETTFLEPDTFVMYDLEGWAATPKAEQEAPYQAMRRFVVAAHAADLKVILVPGPITDKVKAARQEADVFVAQIQAITDPKRYAKICRQLSAVIQANNAGGAGESLVAELSVGRVTGVGQLKALYEAALPIVNGFCLWYGGQNGPAGNHEQQFERGQKFLSWVADQ